MAVKPKVKTAQLGEMMFGKQITPGMVVLHDGSEHTALVVDIRWSCVFLSFTGGLSMWLAPAHALRVVGRK